jgi:hypothetical protein
MKGPGVLAGIGLLLVLAAAAIGTPADADLWGHLTFGRDILERKQIVQADAYSFTSDRAWVNHEWLSETTFAATYQAAGATGLVLLKVAFIAFLLGLLWRHLRAQGIAATSGLALITLAFLGTFWRMHTMRPQLFSVLFFAVLLIVMVGAEQGRRWRLLIAPPLMAIWVNVHGGWIVGLGVLGLWTAMRILDPRVAMNDRLQAAAIGIAAVGATLLNPYGSHMWSFLAETVRFGRPDIEEWGSLLTHPFALGLPWALVLMTAAAALWQSKGSWRWNHIAIVSVLAIASFRVSRLDAFFAVAAIVLLAPELGTLLRRVIDRRLGDSSPGKSQSAGVLAITAIAVAAMLVPAAGIIGPYATCLTIGGPWVPEPEAARFIQLNQLKGRMLTWFDWGQYAIWHFSPDLQVSMDGRRETVYTEATIQAHRRFYAADDTAATYLRAIAPDYIWLPNHLPVSARLAEYGWAPIFSGPVSSVYARDGAGIFQQAGSAGTGMRCFPGP